LNIRYVREIALETKRMPALPEIFATWKVCVMLFLFRLQPRSNAFPNRNAK